MRGNLLPKVGGVVRGRHRHEWVGTGMSRRAGCAFALTILVFLGACGLAAMRPRGDTPVPRLNGRSLDQAENLLGIRGLRLGKVGYDVDANPPHGVVIAQDPQPERNTVAGGKVDIVIAGPELVRVPRVVRAEEADATDALRDARVRRGKVTRVHNDYIPAGVIISQEPLGGTRVARDTKIELVVSLGPDSARMPGVIGRWADDASAFIYRLGLKAKIVHENDPHMEGLVVSQSPAPGVDVPLGDKVTITVSDGPKMVRMPKVIGLSAEDASRRLHDAGLLPRQTPGRGLAPQDMPAGTVFLQQPEPQVSIPVGAVVTFSVYVGQ